MGSPRDSDLHRHVVLALTVLALLYAALAGLRTVGDPDLGWQLATGRYVVQHREIPREDVFAYTIPGKEWIYPPFSGALFYGAYLLGGFAALSWVQALACAGTVALLLRGRVVAASPDRIGTAALAIVAAPAIAFRTIPRADLFSTVLFAAFLALLWQYHRSGHAPLWLLPALMLAWVNLHLGFIAGLVLVGGYVGLELLELPFVGRRADAVGRLRRAAPWLAATVAATLLNPWGPRIYAALLRQQHLLRSLEGYAGDWMAVRLAPARVTDLFDGRNPENAYWWLLMAGALACGVSLWRKQLGAALLLAGAALGSFRYIRFQGLFVIVAVVVAGASLADFSFVERRPWGPRFLAVSKLALLAALLGLVGVRISDLVSNRYYLSAEEVSVFGAGASWWYPERATAFLLRERLPARVVNDYNLGGYLTWRIGPQYQVYLDGRAVPFGSGLVFRYQSLIQQPDSLEWQRHADLLGINTLIFSVARYAWLGNAPLKRFCESQAWRAVYLDEVAAVFLRNRPENSAWLDRLQIDCANARFIPPATRNAAALYNFYANAGSVLFGLERHAEALEALERAQQIFRCDPQLYLIKASVLQATNRLREAEAEYRAALRLRESEQAWYALGQAQAVQGRYREAVDSIQRAARYSSSPHEVYRVLGRVCLAMNQPQDALRAFDRALRLSPYRGEAAARGADFQAGVAAGRARAWHSLGDLARAVSFQEQAVEYSPRDPARWRELAELYQAQGRSESAQQARSRAESLKPQ